MRRIEALDNGLRVILEPSHASNLVSVWAWYRVGSGDEVAGRTGISHWVEHMNFKGTKKLSREEMTGIVERHGGFWNGYTWIDQTTYMSTAHRDALDDLLLLESQRMHDVIYDGDECESERTVILSELQGAENDPDQVLDMAVTAAAFERHPYRNPTIGWRNDLETMTREDLVEHYSTRYAPRNAAIVIAGDIEPDDALARVTRAFGGIDSNEPPVVTRDVEPAQRDERRVVIERPGQVGYVKLAHRAPAFSHADFAPMWVLDAILAGARGLNLWCSYKNISAQRRSRLYRALVDNALASAVQGALMPTRDPFLYYVSITAAEGVRLEDVEAAAVEALDAAAEHGVTGDEVARAKRQLHARMVFEGDSVTNIAHQAGYFHTIGALDAFDRLPERLAAVTASDVHRVARTYLRAGARTVGYFRPAPGA